MLSYSAEEPGEPSFLSCCCCLRASGRGSRGKMAVKMLTTLTHTTSDTYQQSTIVGVTSCGGSATVSSVSRIAWMSRERHWACGLLGTGRQPIDMVLGQQR